MNKPAHNYVPNEFGLFLNLDDEMDAVPQCGLEFGVVRRYYATHASMTIGEQSQTSNSCINELYSAE
jgi:hypothetical protein